MTTPTLPLPYTKVELFISYLSAKQLAPSTITSYLSALSYVHKLMGRPDPTKSFLIQKLLTALSRQRAADVRLPITRPVLHELLRSLRQTNSSAFQRCLYSAMFLLAHPIKLTITDFKHNTSRKPFEILIERVAAMPLCPVQGLINYCHLRGVQPGPLFCHQNLEPITVYHFNTELSRCLTFCCLDTKKYKGHSLDIGAASHAADKGFSDAQTRSLGRWKYDAF